MSRVFACLLPFCCKWLLMDVKFFCTSICRGYEELTELHLECETLVIWRVNRTALEVWNTCFLSTIAVYHFSSIFLTPCIINSKGSLCPSLFLSLLRQKRTSGRAASVYLPLTKCKLFLKGCFLIYCELSFCSQNSNIYLLGNFARGSKVAKNSFKLKVWHV